MDCNNLTEDEFKKHTFQFIHVLRQKCKLQKLAPGERLVFDDPNKPAQKATTAANVSYTKKPKVTVLKKKWNRQHFPIATMTVKRRSLVVNACGTYNNEPRPSIDDIGSPDNILKAFQEDARELFEILNNYRISKYDMRTYFGVDKVITFADIIDDWRLFFGLLGIRFLLGRVRMDEPNIGKVIREYFNIINE